MERFLGWDCANLSLAYGYISVNLRVYVGIRELTERVEEFIKRRIKGRFAGNLLGGHASEETRAAIRDAFARAEVYDEFMQIVNDALEKLQLLQIHDCMVADILSKKVKDTDEIERTKRLRTFLASLAINETSLPKSTSVLIEHQPNKIGNGKFARTNNKSTAVGYQLAFHYAFFNPVFVEPKNKNKICLGENLEYERFLEEALPRYKNRKDAKYHANKNHTKANLLHLIKTFGLEGDIAHIPKSLLDDAADAILQVLQWIVDNNKFAK